MIINEYTRNESHAKRFPIGSKVQVKSTTSSKLWLTKELWIVTGYNKIGQTKDFQNMWPYSNKRSLTERAGFTMKVCVHPESCSMPHVQLDPIELRVPRYKPNGKLSPK